MQFLLLLIAGFLLTASAPTEKSYSLNQVLLEPILLPQFSFYSKTARDRLVIDYVSVIYVNPSTQEQQEQQLDLETYGRIYAVLRQDKGIETPPPEVESYFKEAHLLKMVIVGKMKRTAASAGVFQEVQFVERGDYYRAKEYKEGADVPWVYFYHPNVLQDLMQRFQPG